MFRSSLRGWLLVVSVLFAVLVVGGIALTSYVIISDGMRVVALDTTRRLTRASTNVFAEASVESMERAIATAQEGEEPAELAVEIFIDDLPLAFDVFDPNNVAHALYDADLQLLWSRNSQAVIQGRDAARLEALKRRMPTESVQRPGSLLSGLIGSADLGVTVSHVPVKLPNGRDALLDVGYFPNVEEGVIDDIRGPMSILAISAMFIMLILVHTSMAWVLRLVDNLREAADSIDAGRLDERLPEGANNEIGALARSLNRLIDRLARRANAQTRFVADASHELATPVAGIRGYTSILREWGTEDPAIQAEAINAIDRESGRMARLTRDLLNLLHADQGLRLKSELLDLNVIARDRIAATASRYLEKNLEFDGPQDLSLVMVGDPDRVDDLLSILLDNAAKYTPNDGSIAVKTSKTRDEVMIRVADSGVGIPQAEVSRVFDRFYRSDEVRAAGESGFGLGLSIAKSIVESMQGTIEVESAEGLGTAFTITLPRGRV
jgi:signal transduction histidine kinase